MKGALEAGTDEDRTTILEEGMELKKVRNKFLLYIYCFSTVVDFSSEKYSGSTGHRNSWYQQRNYSEDAEGCKFESHHQQINFWLLVRGMGGRQVSLTCWIL